VHASALWTRTTAAATLLFGRAVRARVRIGGMQRNNKQCVYELDKTAQERCVYRQNFEFVDAVCR
jgi:hypothetical protein